MRSLLSVLGWLGLALAFSFSIACGQGAALPSTVRIAAERAFADRALAIAGESLAANGLSVEPASDLGSADVIISATPSEDADALSFATGYWVAAVQLPSSARDVSMPQLGEAVAGGSDVWTRVLTPPGAPPPLALWWPDVVPGVEALPLDEIPDALAADPAALALLPLAAVDARVRSLTVDGANIVFGTGEIDAYPLTERAWVWTNDTDSRRFDQLVDEAAADLVAQLALPAPDAIIMRATGDMIPSRCAYAKQRDYGDYRHAFLELGPWLAQADVTVGSLDAAISDVSPPFGCTDTFNLAAPAASMDGLAYAGFDVITVATNHVKDCGQIGACGDEAFFATLANLRSRGIEYVGGGADLAEARRPAILTVKGVRFAFLGYDEIASYYHAEAGVPGTAPLEESYLREDVAAAAAQADVVIVLPQWGVEYTADPNERQQALAAAAFESGSTMVIGNHPHWVQAAQAAPGTFVTYALGNFVFDQDWSLETQQGAVLEAAFHGSQLKGVELHPVHIYDEHQPAFAQGAEARQILDRIWDASARLP